MKKYLFYLVIVVALLMFNSCAGIEKIAKVVTSGEEFIMANMDGTIEYNGVFYRQRDGWDHYYNHYDTNMYEHNGEIVGTFIDMYGVWGDISKTCESDFGDSVLKITGNTDIDLCFKNGFSLPDYRTVKIENVYVSGTNAENLFRASSDLDKQCQVVSSFNEEKEIALKDIVNFESPIYYENLYSEEAYISRGYAAFTLIDYDTIYCGFYKLFEYEDEIYILIGAGRTLYKINDEYKQSFKEEMAKM